MRFLTMMLFWGKELRWVRNKHKDSRVIYGHVDEGGGVALWWMMIGCI